jgi:hypothetical protein
LQNEPEAGVELIYPPSTSTNAHKCDNGKARSSHIIFYCGTGRGVPIFDHEENCVYTFLWHTDLVCVGGRDHAEEVECSVETDTGELIDLSPLVSSAGNWEVFDSREDSNYTYSINVCRGLSRVGDNTAALTNDCANGTVAACQTKPGDPTFLPKSLGRANPPVWEDGSLYVEYTEVGTTCGSFNRRRTARIDFVCPARRGQGLGHPVFVREIDCTYYLRWETSAACPINADDEHPGGGSSSGGFDDCSVTDALGNTFDFTALKDVGFEVKGRRELFSIGICAAAKSCAPGVAACSTTTPLAKVEGSLLASDGLISIVYNGTDNVCGGSSITEVILQCDPTVPPDAPIAKDGIKWVLGEVSKNNCFYQFEVSTSLACTETTSDCLVEVAGQSYDLSPLSKVTGNWYAADDRENGKRSPVQLGLFLVGNKA